MRDGQFEAAIRQAAALQPLPYAVYIDYLNQPPELSPMFDPFTFDMDTDELIVFSDEPSIMLNALLEMALYMSGFSTLMGVDEEWKVQVAIGAWRRVREALKQQLQMPYTIGRMWLVQLNPDGVAHFDPETFSLVVTLAGCPDVEIEFPDEAAPDLVSAYRQLSRIFDVIGTAISLQDRAVFNRRVLHAVNLIDEHLAPHADEDKPRRFDFDL